MRCKIKWELTKYVKGLEEKKKIIVRVTKIKILFYYPFLIVKVALTQFITSETELKTSHFSNIDPFEVYNLIGLSIAFACVSVEEPKS